MSGSLLARHLLGSAAGAAGAGLIMAVVILATNVMNPTPFQFGDIVDLVGGTVVVWVAAAIVFGVWLVVAAWPAAWLLRKLGRSGAWAAGLTGAILALLFSETAYWMLQAGAFEALPLRLILVAAVMASGAAGALIYRRIAGNHV